MPGGNRCILRENCRKILLGIFTGSVASLTNLRGSRFTLRIAALKYKMKYQH